MQVFYYRKYCCLVSCHFFITYIYFSEAFVLKTVIKGILFTSLLFCTLSVISCGKECSHSHMTSTVVEPTHEKQGRTVYYCNDCDYEYASDLVPPKGHALATEIHAPTCTEQGYVYNYCSCGYHFSSDFVPPTGHTLSVEAVEPTCDSEGYKIADCSVCGEHYTYDIKSPLGHDLNIERAHVSVKNEVAESHYTCKRCDLDYVGDYLFYHEIYKGAYVDNTTPLAKGIDVSKHQHDVKDGAYLPLDWKAIREAGYEFAILRVGYMGSGNKFVIDPVFEMNYTAAREAGLAVGAYIYSYAYSLEDARAEALAMLDVLEGKRFEYPIFFDIEYKDSVVEEKGLTVQALTDICIEFISTMQEGGYYTALYTNNNWLVNHLDTTMVTVELDIWYARYLYGAASGVVVNEAVWNAELYGKQMAMWQFSETGNIKGVDRNFEKDENGVPVPVSFDLNYCYKDYPTVIQTLGLNGFPPIKDLLNMDGLKSFN